MNKLLSFFTILVLHICNCGVYGKSNIFIWKDSANSMIILKSLTVTNDSFNLKDLKLELGIYVVYIGDNDLQNYKFPNFEMDYDTFDLFDMPLIYTKNYEKCAQHKDSLSDGRWLKVRVNNKSEIGIIKEKNIKNGSLNGLWELKKNSFHSVLLYENGFIKSREVYNMAGSIIIGSYSTCNMIIEEKIWHYNKKLYKHYKDGKVKIYDENGKQIKIKKTDSWGNEL